MQELVQLERAPGRLTRPAANEIAMKLSRMLGLDTSGQILLMLALQGDYAKAALLVQRLGVEWSITPPPKPTRTYPHTRYRAHVGDGSGSSAVPAFALVVAAVAAMTRRREVDPPAASDATPA